jgi:hypothetical protein
MTEPHTPAWVTDLIIALDTYEDEHGTHDDGWPCLADALQGVPPVVLDRARAVANYQYLTGRTTRPADPEGEQT